MAPHVGGCSTAHALRSLRIRDEQRLHPTLQAKGIELVNDECAGAALCTARATHQMYSAAQGRIRERAVDDLDKAVVLLREFGTAAHNAG